MSKTIAIYGASGIGAVLGLFIGMSVSSTVGIIIGSLSSLLVALLGFKNNADGQLHSLSIGTFGFSCILFCLLGVFFRVNNVFEPSVSSEIKKWTADSIFTQSEAKRYIVYDRLGIIPEGKQINTQKEAKNQISGLYSAEVLSDDCEDINRYKDFPIEDELKAYRSKGGIWKRVADSVSIKIAPSDQKKVLHLIKNCLCNE